MLATFFEEMHVIFMSHFTETAYKYKLKIDDRYHCSDYDDDKCVLHANIDSFNNISEIATDLTKQIYVDVVKYQEIICRACGGILHDEYDDDCLFSSKILKKKYLEKVEAEENARNEKESETINLSLHNN